MSAVSIIAAALGFVCLMFAAYRAGRTDRDIDRAARDERRVADHLYGNVDTMGAPRRPPVR